MAVYGARKKYATTGWLMALQPLVDICKYYIKKVP
jgi:hypothetical protein